MVAESWNFGFLMLNCRKPSGPCRAMAFISPVLPELPTHRMKVWLIHHLNFGALKMCTYAAVLFFLLPDRQTLLSFWALLQCVSQNILLKLFATANCL